MRPHAINVARHQPPDEGGYKNAASSRGPELRVAWVERLAESHQFRLGDRVLFCPGPYTCPSVALPIVGMRRTAGRVEYEIRCRDGFSVWVPEGLLRRVTR